MELEKQKLETLAQNEKEKDELLAKQHTDRRTKLPRILAKYGQAVYYIGSYCLKLQHKEERQRLFEKIRKRTPSFARPRFRDWLLSRGKVLRPTPVSKSEDKNRHTRPPAIQPAPVIQSPQELAFLEYAKAVNADRYRVTVIRMGEDGSRKVFILDKKDGQSRGFTSDEIIQKMPELLKLQKRGENIYYTPLSEEKHHILIDDVSPENVVRLQKDGYKPAAIIESSPNNFQCILMG